MNFNKVIAAFGAEDPLPHEEQIKLVRRWQERGDLEARNKLVMSNIRLARTYAIKVYSPTSYALEFDDLVAAAVMGLFISADNFNPDKGVRFITYAIHHIRNEVTKLIRGNQAASVNHTHQMMAIAAKRQYPELSVGEAIKRRYLGSGIYTDGCVLEAAEYVEAAMQKPLRIPLTSSTDIDDGETSWLLPSVEDRGFYEAETAFDLEKVKEAAREVLSPRDRTIFFEVWLEGATYHEVGARHWLSRERVRQICAGCFRKIRKRLGIDYEGLPKRNLTGDLSGEWNYDKQVLRRRAG